MTHRAETPFSVPETQGRRAARGECMLVGRRLQIHRDREQQNCAVEVGYFLVAGRVGRNLVLGSGNWGTPCPRMHTAILRSFASRPEPALETVECERAFRRPEVLVEGVVFDAVVVDPLLAAPKFADVRLVPSPPQPATSIALSSVATTSRCTRGMWVSLRCSGGRHMAPWVVGPAMRIGSTRLTVSARFPPRKSGNVPSRR